MPMSLQDTSLQLPALRCMVDRVRTAADRREALSIRGGGTKAFYGGEDRGGAPLDVRPLAGISSHEPTELVVTARAGTPLAELESALAEHGQCLPFEPPRFGADGTVGGMVASGLCGPARVSVGALRDYVLGVTLLNGRGDVLTFGGQVMKNVAGYDVPRLMVGAMGVLGVVCEVSLKVLPVAAERATLMFEMSAADAVRRCNLWAGQPLPVNASAWHDGVLYIRLAGARAAVRSARQRLGGTLLAEDAAAVWWGGVRDQHHPFFAAPGVGEPLLWRLSVPSTTGPLDVAGSWFVEWGGALRWLRSAAPAVEVRAAATAAGGHATLFRSSTPGAEPFTPLPAPLLAIHRRLKDEFDPAGIFNAGRLHPAL